MSDSTRVDRWLLEAGFDPDPDAELAGRAADELAAAGDDGVPDPWADAAPIVGLDAGQRHYLDATSPDLSGGLPAQLLDGSDPFADLDPDAVADADAAVDDITDPDE